MWPLCLRSESRRWPAPQSASSQTRIAHGERLHGHVEEGWQKVFLCGAGGEHLKQRVNFLLPRIGAPVPLAMRLFPFAFARGGRRYRLRRRNVGARSGAIIVAVSFLPVSNGVERGRDESTRRTRAPGAALVRQAQDRSRDHPRSTAPTGRIPRASSAAAAKGYARDTR